MNRKSKKEMRCQRWRNEKKMENWKEGRKKRSLRRNQKKRGGGGKKIGGWWEVVTRK